MTWTKGKGSLSLLAILIAAILTGTLYVHSEAGNSVTLGILGLYNVTRTDLSVLLSRIGGAEPVMEHCGQQYKEAETNLELSDKYAKAAEVSLQSSNERLAATNALKALNLLGNSYADLLICLSRWRIDVLGNQRPSPIYDVMRHEMRLERLKSVVINMKAEGVDTSRIEGLLLQAERNLSRARISGLSGDRNETAHYLRVVDQLLSDVIDAIVAQQSVKMTKTISTTGGNAQPGSAGEHPTRDHEESGGMGKGGMTGTSSDGGSPH